MTATMTLEQVESEIARLQKLRLMLVAKKYSERLPFASVFDAAFRQVDRSKGSHNFAPLEDIRPLVVGWTKEEFDAELRKMRISGRYWLSAAEGRHGTTKEQREAAIMEDGTMLSYVSQRDYRRYA